MLGASALGGSKTVLGSFWFASLVVLSFGITVLDVLGSFWGRFGSLRGLFWCFFGSIFGFPEVVSVFALWHSVR